MTELLVVIVVLAVLLSLAIPVFQRIREQSLAEKSIVNVRNMQMANLQYATEMNGWYVPFNSNALGPDIYSGQWLRNIRYLEYLGMTSFPHDKPYWPSKYLSPNSTLNRLPDGYGPIARSYGYNRTVFTYGKPTENLQALRNTQVFQPSKLLAFADSLDFFVTIEGAGRYNGEEVYLDGGVAYRYRWRAAVAFFDGHAALLTPGEVADNKELWINQTPR